MNHNDNIHGNVQVLAVDNGVVIFAGSFWAGTSRVSIKHADGRIVNYCEIEVGSGIKVGDIVTQGQVLGKVI